MYNNFRAANMFYYFYKIFLKLPLEGGHGPGECVEGGSWLESCRLEGGRWLECSWLEGGRGLVGLHGGPRVVILVHGLGPNVLEGTQDMLGGLGNPWAGCLIAVLVSSVGELHLLTLRADPGGTAVGVLSTDSTLLDLNAIVGRVFVSVLTISLDVLGLRQNSGLMLGGRDGRQGNNSNLGQRRCGGEN